ncbi:MAG: hypothetical protein FJ320_12760 [SAR202 cluster bacterium]|nr:hypothetical protein [SAR202 cluster bacterium]
MPPVIRIDEEVQKELEARAMRFGMVFSTPNEVLRRVLELTKNNGTSGPRAASATSSIDIEVETIYYHRKYNLIFIPRDKRSFFPGYNVTFTLKTDVNESPAHVTSAPKGTAKGEPLAGQYIKGNLKPWFDKHKALSNGAVLRFTELEKGKRYQVEIIRYSS